MDRLTECDEILTKVNANLKDANGKDADTLTKATKKITEEIKKIREMINGKTSERQGYGQVPQTTVLSVYRTAQQAIRGKTIAPGVQEERLVFEAEHKVKQSLKVMNQFILNSWADYRKLVESKPLKMFKEYKEID